MSENKTFKVAVIGAGDMGNQHVKGWKLAGHEVVSITDLDTVRAKELADANGIPKVFGDYKEAASDPSVDIVSICLPLKLHAPVTIYAAGQGKHVFCEKPMTGNFADAAAMEEAVTKAGVQFGVGFQRNFTNSRKMITQWVQEGKFGSPMAISSNGMAMVRPKRVMHDANGNNGPIMDTCCHYFIMWQSIFQSRPKTIYARGQVLAKDHPGLSHIEKLAIDTGIITIEYESGDLAEMFISWGMPDGFKMKGRPDRLIGPKGGVEGAFNSTVDKLTLYIGDTVEEVPVDKKQNLHEEEFRVFAEALQQGKPAPVSFQVGKEILAVTLAVFESIETGQPVQYKHPE